MTSQILKQYADAVYVIEHPEGLSDKEIDYAKNIRQQVDTFLNGQTIRIQRIFRYRYIQHMNWQQIANRMGRRCSADSVRQELYRAIRLSDTS